MGDERQQRRRVPWAAATVLVACLFGQTALADEGLATGADESLRPRREGDDGQGHRHHRPAQRHPRPGQLLLLLQRLRGARAGRGRERPGAQRRLHAAGLVAGHRRPLDPAGADLLPQPALRAVAHDRADLRRARREAAVRRQHARRPGVRDVRRLRGRGCRSQQHRGGRPVAYDVRRHERRLHVGREGLDDHAHDGRHGPRAATGPWARCATWSRPTRRPSTSRGSRCCSTGSRTTESGPTPSPRRSPWGCRPRGARGDAVARWPRAHPGGRLASLRGTTTGRPERRRDRHRSALRRRPDLPRALPRVGLGERFDQRWVFEGLAEVLAERRWPRPAANRRGTPPSRGGRRGGRAQPLGGSAGSRSADLDACAYPAACAGTRALLADLEGEQLAAVVGAGLRGERASTPRAPGTPTADAPPGRAGSTSWRSLAA